jgi:hypothetical protein
MDLTRGQLSLVSEPLPFHDFLGDEEGRLFSTKPKEITT